MSYLSKYQKHYTRHVEISQSTLQINKQTIKREIIQKLRDFKQLKINFQSLIDFIKNTTLKPT